MIIFTSNLLSKLFHFHSSLQSTFQLIHSLDSEGWFTLATEAES